jgi:hypothetical protein
MRPAPRIAAATFAAATVAMVGVTGTAVLPAASAASPPKTITVTMSAKTIAFGTSSIPAGQVVFTVKSAKGNHTLQLAQLASGYTQKQAEHDINAAFGGDVKAVRRVDKNIHWLGGADTAVGHPGRFVAHLTAGSYLAIDQESNATTSFDVVSAASNYRTIYPSSFVTTKNNRFHTHTGLALPHDGWMKYHNNAVEPHFIVLNRVKQSTTNQDVRDYAASGSNKQPSWGLGESTDAGVISPGTTEVFRYSLPAGKYLIACFWPSKHTGMPHFNMGMWKLVELS